MKMMTAMYTLRRGGAYDRFIMMNEAFLERGWEVHCLSLTPIQIKHSFFYNHRMYFPFKKVDGMMAKLSVLFLFPVWTVWVGWRNRIDLIIAFGSLYAFIQILSKWALKKPIVTLIRGDSTFAFKMQRTSKYIIPYINKIDHIGLRFSDRIITNNEASRIDILNRLGRKRNIDVQVLYNNIPPINISDQEDVSKIRHRYGIPEDAKVIVTAGIINGGKNIEILIQCLSKIKSDNIYLFIAGDGSTKTDFRYKDYLKQLAIDLRINQRVIFTGWLEKEELWKIYQASDLFILPSLNEGMPNAMLEALGCGLPCIGSDIPGIRDILQDNELLFDPLDESLLVNKIEEFYSDELYSKRIIQLCQTRKKEFIFDWKEKLFEIASKNFLTDMKVIRYD